jgi:hypothetical protein
MLTANQASTRKATETWKTGNKLCLSSSILEISATSISVKPSEDAIWAATTSLENDIDIDIDSRREKPAGETQGYEQHRSGSF